MDKLLKSRAASRGWATREAGNITSSVLRQETPPSIERLKVHIDEFDNRIAAVDKAQRRVEEAADDDTLEEYIREAYDYRIHLIQLKMEMKELLAELVSIKAASTSISSSSNNSLTHNNSNDNVNNNSNVGGLGLRTTTSTTRLPKLEIRKFSGLITEWQTFWDQFQASVGTTNLANIHKFTYLRNLLEGEALTSIVGLTLTEANYDIAVKSLNDRFGRPERIIFSHIQALLNMEVHLQHTGNLTASSLWNIRDQLNVHIRSLEALGVSGDKYGVILTPIILSKLPTDITLEWARTGVGREADLAYLLEFLKVEIERRERAETCSQPVTEKQRPSSTVSAMQTTVRPNGRISLRDLLGGEDGGSV